MNEKRLRDEKEQVMDEMTDWQHDDHETNIGRTIGRERDKE